VSCLLVSRKWLSCYGSRSRHTTMPLSRGPSFGVAIRCRGAEVAVVEPLGPPVAAAEIVMNAVVSSFTDNCASGVSSARRGPRYMSPLHRRTLKPTDSERGGRTRESFRQPASTTQPGRASDAVSGIDGLPVAVGVGVGYLPVGKLLAGSLMYPSWAKSKPKSSKLEGLHRLARRQYVITRVVSRPAGGVFGASIQVRRARTQWHPVLTPMAVRPHRWGTA
jgi:hypothetical protein